MKCEKSMTFVYLYLKSVSKLIWYLYFLNIDKCNHVKIKKNNWIIETNLKFLKNKVKIFFALKVMIDTQGSLFVFK